MDWEDRFRCGAVRVS